jgi:hypothetical protein
LDHPVTGGHKYRDLVLQFWGLEARLMTLLCKKKLLSQNPKKWTQNEIWQNLLRKAKR